MDAKHTPGPWHVAEHPDGDLTTRITDDPRGWMNRTANYGIRIADVWCGDMEDGATNARLIAAAPELLEVAFRILRYFDEQESDEPGTTEGRWQLRPALSAAIAKARGEDR